jgi:transaldolase
LEESVAIFLDSALPEEARQAFSLGYVRGITTNPALLARTGRPSEQVLRELRCICSGTVFYQLTAETPDERKEEGERILHLNEEALPDAIPSHPSSAASAMPEGTGRSFGRIGLKIPACTQNMALVAGFAARGVEVAVTAMFSLAQAYAACEAGATYLLPYVNRMTRLRGDGIAFVRDLVQVCQAVNRGTSVLAASIKSPEEAVKTLLAGARHVSMPLAVLQAMGQDALSEQAIAEFTRAASS